MSNLTIQGVLKNYSHRAIKPFNKDVDERNCIRFTNSNNELYEFGPPKGEIDVWKALRNPVLKKIFE